MSDTPREKFQDLLRELFQIQDTAELDFGIYRIMGQKRGVIERFINEGRNEMPDIDLDYGMSPWAHGEGPLRTWEAERDNIDDLVECVQSCLSLHYVSFEPLLERVDPDLFGISWVIIGADSNRGAKKPPKEWADIIIGAARKKSIPVFVKDNYGYDQKIKEMPITLGP